MNITTQGRIEAERVLSAVGRDFEPTDAIAQRARISVAKVRQVLPKLTSLEWRLVRTLRGASRTVPIYEWRRKG